MTPSRDWKKALKPGEICRGVIALLAFVLLLPRLTAFVQRIFVGDYSAAQAGIVYYLFSAGLCFLLLWGYLGREMDALLKRPGDNAVALALALLGAALGSGILVLLPFPVANPVKLDWAAEFQLSPAATVVIVVVLMPLVQELLFRGVVFGAVRGRNRALAYLLSALGFGLSSCWQWAVSLGDPRYFLLVLQYVPLSLAACWCYERGGSVWSAVVLHLLYNGGMLAVLA